MNDLHEACARLETQLSKTVDRPDGVFTAREMADASGTTTNWAQERIRRGIAAGLIVYYGQVDSSDVCGRKQHIPAYRFAKNVRADVRAMENTAKMHRKIPRR